MAVSAWTKVRWLKPYLLNQFNIPSPLFVSHILTLKCNMRCNYCTFWAEKQKEPELSTEEVFDFLRQCKSLNSIVYGMTGGEPLLRKDLVEIARFSKELGMVNSMTTNGLLLEKRIDEMLPYLDHVGISLDALDETHAKIRGLNEKGLSEKVQEAIKLAAGKEGLRVDINTVINGANLDQVPALVQFAKDNGTTISLQPVIEGENTPAWISLKDKMEKYTQTIDKLIQMKKQGYPILNTTYYLNIARKKSPWLCKVGRFMLELTPAGGVIFPCGSLCLPEGGIQETIIGSIREKKLRDIWLSEEAKRLREEATRCVNNQRCFLNCYVEMSLLLTKKPSILQYLNSLK